MLSPRGNEKANPKEKVKERTQAPNYRIPRIPLPNTASSSSNSQADGKKQQNCIFFPKGLCRRGKDCPYRHEGNPPAAANAKSQAKAVPKPKAAMVAWVGSVLAGAAQAAPLIQEVYDVEWALDSGAGEHLASKESLEAQGIPSSVLEECEAVSQYRLTFSTGGGLKEANLTIRTEGDRFGERLIYMLKRSPFVKSLGKLVESGFSFVWVPIIHTLFPEDVGFNVDFGADKCIVADRVEHCVPVFKETVSFVHGMPAGHPASDAVPDDGAATPILVPEPIEADDDDDDDVQIIEPARGAPRGAADFEVLTPLRRLHA